MLTVEELKSLKVGDLIFIIDYDNNTTIPPHKTKRQYKIINNLDDELYCQSIGYSLFQYKYYGNTWIAYKNKKLLNYCHKSLDNIFC